jgi:hypothetical protein
MKTDYHKQKGMRILFPRHGLHLRLQAIKLLTSLTYPLKRTKGQSIPHPTTPQPTPRRCPTQRQAPRDLRVQVEPEAATPELVAQVR